MNSKYGKRLGSQVVRVAVRLMNIFGMSGQKSKSKGWLLWSNSITNNWLLIIKLNFDIETLNWDQQATEVYRRVKIA